MSADFTVNDPFLGLVFVVKGELKSVLGMGCWSDSKIVLHLCLSCFASRPLSSQAHLGS